MTETPRLIGVPSGESTFPVLPLRDIVVFPHMIVPLFVGREKSINALEEVMRADKQIMLATQKDAGDDDPSPQAIYEVGTLATVLQLLKLPDGTVKVLVEGRDRAQILRYTERQNYFEAEARILTETVGEEVEVEALARSVVSEFENYVKLNKKVSPEVLSAVANIEDYSKLADTVASHLAVRIPEKQEILALTGVVGAPGEGARHDGERDLRPAGREAHPLARQAPDGEDAARVLSERADEGDPEGARRRRGRPRRDARARGAHRQDEVLQGSAREGRDGAEEAPPDEPDVGRSDGRAQLSRLAARHSVEEALQGQERPRASPRRC